jgi:hypothetical protein
MKEGVPGCLLFPHKSITLQNFHLIDKITVSTESNNSKFKLAIQGHFYLNISCITSTQHL